MLIPYGFFKDTNGAIRMDIESSKIVCTIFNLYLNGYSLKKITEHFAENEIPSPTGKSSWTVQTIDNMLTNEKYIHIVSSEVYTKTQLEKQRRSNTNPNKKRKSARYNSENVLSGLLVCGECGNNFRRITRQNGEIVWRCADRVENGKQAVCQNMHTILDIDIKKAICDYLEIGQYDDAMIKNSIYRVDIYNDSVTFIGSSEQLFSI